MTFKVSEVRTHPRFSRVGFYNDIAVLVLDRPVRKSKYVIPVCLPKLGHIPPPERLAGKLKSGSQKKLISNEIFFRVIRPSGYRCWLGNNILRWKRVDRSATSRFAHLAKRRLQPSILPTDNRKLFVCWLFRRGR